MPPWIWKKVVSPKRLRPLNGSDAGTHIGSMPFSSQWTWRKSWEKRHSSRSSPRCKVSNSIGPRECACTHAINPDLNECLTASPDQEGSATAGDSAACKPPARPAGGEDCQKDYCQHPARAWRRIPGPHEGAPNPLLYLPSQYKHVMWGRANPFSKFPMYEVPLSGTAAVACCKGGRG